MDAWGWSALEPWLADRVELPVGPLFCVIDGPTRGRAWSASAARNELHHLALKAGVRRRLAPHQLRHAHAVELLHEGIPLPLIQRQLGHSHLSTTGTYLRGDRLRGDHLHGPRAARADDARQRRPRPVSATVRERMMRSRTLWHACLPGKQQPGVSDPPSPHRQSQATGSECRSSAVALAYSRRLDGSVRGYPVGKVPRSRLGTRTYRKGGWR